MSRHFPPSPSRRALLLGSAATLAEKAVAQTPRPGGTARCNRAT